ncbi:hypothetical protein Tco_0492795 [Tanacetum coccineum]
MTTLQFADTHDMVAFLSKPAESEGFEQIVKTVNRELQLQALVDRKKIIVNEASVRRDLQLNDEEGTDFLPNATIFEELTRMGTMASAIICLATSQKFNFSKYIFESMVKNLENVSDEAVNEEMDDSLKRAATTATILEAKQDSGNIDKTRSKATLNEPSSLGTSSGSGPKRQDTMRDTIARTRSTRVISFDEASLGDQEDASKQGRKIDDIDKDAEITLVDETQGRYGDEEMFDTGVLDGDEVFKNCKSSEKANVIEEPSESITTTPTLITTTAATTITTVSTRPRVKGLVIHEEEQETTPTVSSQQPSQVKEQDKGKGIMVEEPMKMKKNDQISLDEELAFKLQAEEEEEERLGREKARREEEANIVA